MTFTGATGSCGVLILRIILSIFSSASSFCALPASSSTNTVSSSSCSCSFSSPIGDTAAGPTSMGTNFLFLTGGTENSFCSSRFCLCFSISLPIFSSVYEPTFLTGFEKKLNALISVVPVKSIRIKRARTIRIISAPVLPARASSPPPITAPRTPPLLAVTAIRSSHTYSICSPRSPTETLSHATWTMPDKNVINPPIPARFTATEPSGLLSANITARYMSISGHAYEQTPNTPKTKLCTAAQALSPLMRVIARSISAEAISISAVLCLCAGV